MNMTPSEQQSMEIAASALAMEALYKDGSSSSVRVSFAKKQLPAELTHLGCP
jgi:hypothetical protein